MMKQDGTPESVRFAEAIDADGVLLNDIRMAVSVMKENGHKKQ